MITYEQFKQLNEIFPIGTVFFNIDKDSINAKKEWIDPK